MPTLEELRLEARLSRAELGRRAGVATSTVSRAENGLPMQKLKAYAIVKALGEALEKEIKISDVEGLVIWDE
jgi:transcriptional regulator with XRE-family HTH domain